MSGSPRATGEESNGAAAQDTMARVFEHFALELRVIFVDGFEDGTTGAWSLQQ